MIKKITLIAALLLINKVSAQTTFGWENTTQTNNVITETINGITLSSTASSTVSTTNFFDQQPTGSSGLLLRTDPTTQTVTFSFNRPVNITSIFVSVVSGNNNLVFTPTIATNTNTEVSSPNIIFGRNVVLNWTNVTAFTVSSNTDEGNFFLFDNLVVTEAVLSTKDIIADTNFNVYPNPVKDNLNITSNIDIDFVEVFNSTGALVTSGKNITFKNLPNGIYLLKAKTKKGYITKKIIKE